MPTTKRRCGRTQPAPQGPAFLLLAGWATMPSGVIRLTSAARHAEEAVNAIGPTADRRRARQEILARPVILRGCESFDYTSARPQSVGCVKRTVHDGLWCVSRTLQRFTASEAQRRISAEVPVRADIPPASAVTAPPATAKKNFLGPPRQLASDLLDRLISVVYHDRIMGHAT